MWNLHLSKIFWRCIAGLKLHGLKISQMMLMMPNVSLSNFPGRKVRGRSQNAVQGVNKPEGWLHQWDVFSQHLRNCWVPTDLSNSPQKKHIFKSSLAPSVRSLFSHSHLTFGIVYGIPPVHFWRRLKMGYKALKYKQRRWGSVFILLFKYAYEKRQAHATILKRYRIDDLFCAIISFYRIVLDISSAEQHAWVEANQAYVSAWCSGFFGRVFFSQRSCCFVCVARLTRVSYLAQAAKRGCTGFPDGEDYYISRRFFFIS